MVPRRGVHLDLKGNPPTPKRLLEHLDLFAALKLDLVLAEWEDTFPWKRYPELRSSTAYSPEFIREFHAKADALGIEVVPLVQCFGHAENVLSRARFRSLRERPTDVAEYCGSHPGSARLINELIEDVLSLSGRNIRRFHLGGDEAWHMGSCPRCRKAVRRIGRDRLYLGHIRPLLDNLHVHGLRPILWDDMMRKWPATGQRAIAREADLMAWSYGADPVAKTKGHLTEKHLQGFARSGVTTWAASAYKGGDGPWPEVPDVDARIKNNLNWVAQFKSRKLAGMVATAWSRYTVFMSPCETTEASLHTLVLTAAGMWDGNLPVDPVRSAEQWLGRWRGGRELRRFRACHGAAAALEQWQKSAVEWALTEADRAPHRNGEPTRFNPAVDRRYTDRIREDLRRGRKLGASFVRAHAGTIPRIWLERYVTSRLIPFTRRARSVLAAAPR